ncbi:uncharacterized protein ACA1_173920 [Acanthamoeba castellanii str. Neff]|uniref:Uncharacterized protein n=1 Tax=Acanthamoeba castellanii (strain ATCC 30010 / Neff) TaxID=1257118 RepID=L8HGQ6_ACACF|nr:uncharacterized protein ACA1_173920 [Acanthamoeba castellanii str. Neff]ELR24734.1 hypothetical protein ACA1_173920 [Acanthamoeba castellanii str. Neff]
MSIADKIDENYKKIAEVIRNHGQPNPLFPKDRDLTYAETRWEVGARTHLASTMGLGTVLKNMKKKQYVDFQDDFIKDTTLITLIHSFDEAIVSQIVLYHEIGDKVKDSTDESHHTRTAGW